MSRRAGVLRDAGELEGLRQALGRGPAGQLRSRARTPDLATVEATNLHSVAVLVAAAALARAESRGFSRWRDQPPPRPAETAEPARSARHTIVHVEDGRPRVTGAARAKVGTRE